MGKAATALFAVFALAACTPPESTGDDPEPDDDPPVEEPITYEECPESQCSNHGSCEVIELRPHCTCDPGYTGVTCSRCDDGYHRDALTDACVVDETCTDDSCGAGGTCSIERGQTVCTCDPGWAGNACTVCAPGFHDDDGACVQDQVCLANTCSGQGTCDDSSGPVVCTCDPGFSGDFCETDDTLDGSCEEEDPCGPGGTCNDAGGIVTCACAPGYTGETCEDCYPGYHVDDDGGCVLDETCFANTCSDGGSCSLVEGVATCACFDGYEGERCETCAEGYHRDPELGCLLDESCEDEDPCGPGGTCVDDDGVVRCACDPAYAGPTCEVCYPGYHDEDGVCVLDEVCGAASCGVAGVCEDAGGVVTCECPAGYGGDYCEVNVDDCVNNACGDGECIDLLDDRVCHCTDGTYGESCPD